MKPDHGAGTLNAWINSARPSFSEQDLVSALEDMTRSTTAADLSARDRDFWDKNSGIAADHAAVAIASAANAAARLVFDASALTAAEVAERMHMSASTIRHYKSARKLYSYLVNGKLAFPQWQFNDTGDQSIPSLEDVLGALPDDLHPQAVAGFFLTPQPDLVLNGMHVSAKSWLEAGGSKKVVVDLAEGLAAGY
ncbi:helix-turn-helix domain-containing protein [Pseudarthrobacter sp. MDT3-1]